jgi:hypothetical protein
MIDASVRASRSQHAADAITQRSDDPKPAKAERSRARVWTGWGFELLVFTRRLSGIGDRSLARRRAGVSPYLSTPSFYPAAFLV